VVAEEGIDKLRESVDTLIIIPNERLLEISDERTGVLEAFGMADLVLSSGVRGITDLITTPGLINVDFADVKTVMADAGSAVMGIGSSTGENRASQAADKAISSPLLETSMEGARGVLLSIAGPEDMTLHEISTAAGIIADHCDADANIIFGAVVDDALGSEMKVTVIAAGFDRDRRTTTRSPYPEFTPRSTRPEPEDDLDIPGFVSG